MADDPHASDPLTAPSSWSADDRVEVDRSERRRRLPLLLGAAAGVVVVAVVAWVLVAKPFDGQHDRIWPPKVDGRPAGLGERDQAAIDVTPDVDPGAYLWSDFDGWHLWIVFGDGLEEATGTIRSGDELSKTVLSPAAAGSARADGKVLAFDVSSAGDVPVAGIDFEPGFYSKRLEVTIEGPDGPLPADQVHIGSSGASEATPIVIEKVDKPSS